MLSACRCAAAVGYSEEDAIAKLAGDVDVYVSKFKPMKCVDVPACLTTRMRCSLRPCTAEQVHYERPR